MSRIMISVGVVLIMCIILGDWEVESKTRDVDYKDVRIQKFNLSMQCWTFREFTFFETLSKVKELGIEYLEPYPGQPLGGELEGLKFDQLYFRKLFIKEF